jgi:hypothetical protein
MAGHLFSTSTGSAFVTPFLNPSSKVTQKYRPSIFRRSENMFTVSSAEMKSP